MNKLTNIVFAATRNFLLTNYANYEAIFTLIARSTVIGELVLALWLLLKGAKTAKEIDSLQSLKI